MSNVAGEQARLGQPSEGAMMGLVLLNYHVLALISTSQWQMEYSRK